jgi:hypothetical protein
MNDGETKVYENTNAFPRVFFVDTIQQVTSSKDALSALFNPSNNLREKAIVENMDSKLAQPLATGNIISVDYSAEDIKIAVEMKGVGFLVLTDSYYPTWKAQLLNQITQQHMSIPIYRTDYALRGVLVPKGKYVVEFYNSLF